jgi:hypothetical protein
MTTTHVVTTDVVTTDVVTTDVVTTDVVTTDVVTTDVVTTDVVTTDVVTTDVEDQWDIYAHQPSLVNQSKHQVLRIHKLALAGRAFPREDADPFWIDPRTQSGMCIITNKNLPNRALRLIIRAGIGGICSGCAFGQPNQEGHCDEPWGCLWVNYFTDND